MIYQILAAIIGLLAVLMFFIAFKSLFNKSWIAGFLRGATGFLALALSALFAFSVQDVLTYKVAESDHAIATLSFRQKELYQFEVDLQETNGGLRKANLQGEQWQLDARMFKWSPLFGAMGLRMGYRLDNLQGRYQVLEMDRSTERSHEVLSTSSRVDIWGFLSAHAENFSSVQAVIASPGFVPMADGAIFEVVLAGSNVVARPLNDAAKTAMANW